MDSFEVKKIIIAEIYAFRRKKCELRTGPGALAPPLPGPSFWPGSPDICKCCQVGDPALYIFTH